MFVSVWWFTYIILCERECVFIFYLLFELVCDVLNLLLYECVCVCVMVYIFYVVWVSVWVWDDTHICLSPALLNSFLWSNVSSQHSLHKNQIVAFIFYSIFFIVTFNIHFQLKYDYHLVSNQFRNKDFFIALEDRRTYIMFESETFREKFYCSHSILYVFRS